MSDFNVGDVVVCVDAAPCRNPEASPTINLTLHRAYRVSFIRPSFEASGDYHILVDGERPHGVSRYGSLGWDSARFRKLNDGDDDAELIARIKNCRPTIPELPRVTTEVVRLNPEVWGAQIMDDEEEGRG